MSNFDKPTMRARFWEKQAVVDKFNETVAPLRDEMNALVEQYTPLIERKNELGKQIKEIQAEFNLGEVKGEISFISKGLGGKVGQRPGRG